MCLTPRNAFFSPSKTVHLEHAAGCINTEIICPYPPGIPILLPGEVITSSAIDTLRQILAAGGFVTGGSDPTCQTLKVVKN
jgi:arginine decarboxylase